MKEPFIPNKKLSIIMPAYNSAQYIKDCLDSCEKQDISADDYEIIVINDGSSDNTLQIVSECQQNYSNIRILDQKNSGQSVARNAGVKIAKGEYLWFVDSDDKISANCLGTILRIMKSQDLEALCIMPHMESLFSEFLPVSIKYSVVDGEAFILRNNPIYAPWGYVFKTSFWVNNQFEFIPGIYFEDAQLIPIVLSKCKKIGSLPKDISCYNYIYREGSTMNSAPNLKKIKGCAVITDTHMKYSMELESLALKKYFQSHSSFTFIKGVKMIYQLDKNNYNVNLDNFCKSIAHRPHMVSGSSIRQRLEQFIILYFPYGACRMRKLFHR